MFKSYNIVDNPFDVIMQGNQCIARSCRSQKYSSGQKYIEIIFSYWDWIRFTSMGAKQLEYEHNYEVDKEEARTM